MRVRTQQDYWAAKPIISRENKNRHGIDEGHTKINGFFLENMHHSLKYAPFTLAFNFLLTTNGMAIPLTIIM